MSEYLDISFPIKSEMAIYPNNPGFFMRKSSDIENGDACTVAEICMGTHTGTHIDAPAHFISGGIFVEDIPLEQMNGKVKVLDVTGKEDIDISDVTGASYGERLIFKTNNSKYFLGSNILDDYVTLTYRAAEYLANAGIFLVGLDYLSLERPRNKRDNSQSVHKIILSKNIVIMEGLDLRRVEPGEYQLNCFPLRIEKADGCPVRVVLSKTT